MLLKIINQCERKLMKSEVVIMESENDNDNIERM